MLSLSALGGGEGWGEVGEATRVAAHRTLPSRRDGPPSPQAGGEGYFVSRPAKPAKEV
jgi:hypothetical protein